jgi:hypothetical protein
MATRGGPSSEGASKTQDIEPQSIAFMMFADAAAKERGVSLLAGIA